MIWVIALVLSISPDRVTFVPFQYTNHDVCEMASQRYRNNTDIARYGCVEWPTPPDDLLKLIMPRH